MLKRWQFALAALAVAAVGAFAAWAVLRDSEPTASSETPPSVAAPTPTPTQAAALADRDEALRLLREASPSLADPVEAVESGDVAALDRAVSWRSIICGQGGEFSPSCEQLGLPEGTSIDVVWEAMGPFLVVTWGFDRVREPVLAQLTELLADGAALDLIATDGNGLFVLGYKFASPRPAPPDLPGITYERFLLQADSKEGAPIHAYSFGLSSSRPFDSARSEEQQGHPYQVWWMSESLAEGAYGHEEATTGN